MALRINYNYSADFTLVNLNQTELQQNKSLERLSTGFRINRAADDAAGYFIANQLKQYAASLQQGTRNANDGISISQIAQGALKEVYNILVDIKSKVIQAANTSDDTSRGQIQQDINSLADAIAKIFKDTEFNGINLFSGAGPTTFTIHYGGRIGQELVMTTASATVQVGTGTNTPSTVAIGGTDYAIDVTSQTAANASVSTVDALIKAVDDMAAKFGSYQIELEKIISNNETARVNTSEAESRIRNVDMANEMANFTKLQILMQSGTAMLAQANAKNQLVLQLLR
ncbi:flagellin N-terminal helical domain-containing protein [Sulfurihydrogenibium yellowstonense]|uniref:Flagellin n=1 Tax=Sulfurihydrogenibium yellowstonense SS-5 TaxID=432331 RepID=C4FM52_9AQUI|nr:flagellin [Sulfurihydrogenibium yellowstonense]EEP59847.1 flagellar filament 34.5 kDa core protein [Sulfurihydrogenibium yellowstonense SS-5]